MNTSLNNEHMAQGPSRAETRGQENSLVQGANSEILPVQLFRLQKIKNPKKYSLCFDKRCRTCKHANKAQIEPKSNNTFCKSNHIIYLIECLECNLKYIGQTSNNLNLRINGHRSDIKNFGKKYKKDFELQHFQKHSFEKIFITIIDEEEDESSRLDKENIHICEYKTLYPYGLNSKINGQNNLDLERNMYLQNIQYSSQCIH